MLTLLRLWGLAALVVTGSTASPVLAAGGDDVPQDESNVEHGVDLCL